MNRLSQSRFTSDRSSPSSSRSDRVGHTSGTDDFRNQDVEDGSPAAWLTQATLESMIATILGVLLRLNPQWQLSCLYLSWTSQEHSVHSFDCPLCFV